MVKKEDWKTTDMPKENTTFEIELSLTEENKKYLQEGYLPTCMEDKWFIYYENNKYYFHRSWTGYCIYILEEIDNNKYKVTVSRNKEEYLGEDIEQEKELLLRLINHYARIKEGTYI